MRRALWWLLWRQLAGPFRSIVRKPWSSRGLAVLLMLGFLLAVLAFQRSDGLSALDVQSLSPEVLRFWAPWALLALTSLGALAPPGIHFRPSDVAFLFSAPIPARELVLYNVLLSTRASLLSSLWIALLQGLRGVRQFVGILIVLLFLQIATQFLAALRAWLAMRTSFLARHALSVGVGCVVLVMATLETFGIAFSELPLAWREAPAQLTRPFIEANFADSWSAGAPWLLTAVLELSVLVALTCVLGARVHEASFSASLRAQEMRARRRSGGFFSISRPNTSLRLPQFPRLAGAGPVAWRQSMGLLRNPRGAALYLGILALPLVVIAALKPSFGLIENPEVSHRIFSTTLLTTFLSLSIVMSGNLTFDFRIDLDRMAQLMALPISSLALAVGQTFPVALFTTMIQWVGMGLMFGIFDIPLRTVTELLVVLPAANWAAICVENAIFLLFPYRTVPEDPGDVGFAGRVLAVMTAKMLVLGVLAALAAAGGFGVFLLVGSRPVAFGVAGLLLAGACVLLLRFVAWAFRRFDVTADQPG